MSSKSIKKDQNENWAPTIRGGGVFVRASVVRRGDRFFPGTLFQDRHRRPQAAGEPEKGFVEFNQKGDAVFYNT